MLCLRLFEWRCSGGNLLDLWHYHAVDAGRSLTAFAQHPSALEFPQEIRITRRRASDLCEEFLDVRRPEYFVAKLVLPDIQREELQRAAFSHLPQFAVTLFGVHHQPR